MVTATNPQTKTITKSITWSVPSATTKGVTYEVRASVDDGRLECNCPARVVCWHIKAVASGAIGKPRVRVSQRPARPAFSLDTLAAVASLDI